MEPTWQSDDGRVRLFLGDCRDVIPSLASIDLVVTDPPYGETSLAWDRMVDWLALVRPVLKDRGSVWAFGSLKHFIRMASSIEGWTIAQDLLWEKHNGSNAFKDRFRRVHEHAVQFYKTDAPWSEVTKNPQFTNDATARTVRRKKKTTHWNRHEDSEYTSIDGGPRLMRSVMFCRSCHGHAEHPTQKPVEVALPLIAYSSNSGDVVADCFMGSGSFGVGAIQLGRSFVGIESDPVYFAIAQRRISEAMSADPRTQQELFT